MSIVYPNFLKPGSLLRQSFSWKALAGLFLCSLLFASFYKHIYDPLLNLKPVHHLHEVIASPTGDHRGYFRHNFWLDQAPDNAYLILSSDDYQLYVNGNNIGVNQFSINASNPFTGKLSQRGQSLVRIDQFSLARAPELQKIANRERQYAHYYDLTPFLQPGKNNISLGIQSDQNAQFAFSGRILIDDSESSISSDPQAWKFNPISANDRFGRFWFDREYYDIDWRTAVNGGAVDYDIYALDAESVWARPFTETAYALTTEPVIERLRGMLPGKTTFSTASESTSWLRVQSSRQFSLYIGKHLIGVGVPGQLITFNISQHITAQPQPISLVAVPDDLGYARTHWIKVDGSILGNPIDDAVHWHRYMNAADDGDAWMEQNLTADDDLWSPLALTEVLNAPMRRTYLPQDSSSLFQYQQYLGIAALFLCVLVGWVLFFTFRGNTKADDPVQVDAGSGGAIQLGARASPCIHYWWYLSFLAVVVGVMHALRYRFMESDAILFFLSSEGRLTFIALIVAASLLWFVLQSSTLPRYPNSLATLHSGRFLHSPYRWLKANADAVTNLLLFIIILGGVYLRVFGIDSEDLQADENVSWDAARGILRIGSPEAVSGVLYTRSPLYHYLLALWLWVFGDNMIIARLFSVVPAVGVMILTYVLVHTITRNRIVGLVAVLFISLDSWLIQISHIIRFYQQMQFFSLLATYFFLKGFVWRKGKFHQYAFLIACTAAGLSQEVFITVFPAYVMAFVLFYRNFDWKNELYLLIGFITMMTIIILDIFIFSIMCLTPHVSVATTSGSIMQLHLSKVLGFFNTFFIGNNRVNVLLSLVTFAGIPYWLHRRSKAIFCLYLLIFLTVITSTVLVMQIAARYLISIYPYMVILGILTVYYGAGDFARRLGLVDALRGVHPDRIAKIKKYWLSCVSGVVLMAFVVHLQPDRTLASINHPRFPQHLTALEYIKRHHQDGDKILSVAPMQAAIIFEGIDYYLQTKLYFDEMYLVDRGIVDRWSGGTLITSTDRVRETFLRNPRVWVILDELEKRNLTDEVLEVLYRSAVMKSEFFGVEVLLWDRSSGALLMTENRGGSYNQF